jgi:hypothetical protein
MSAIFENVIAARAERAFAPDEPVWVFGTGSFGRTLARALATSGFDVKGFVQTRPDSLIVDDLPVRGWSELSKRDCQMTLLVGIFNREAPFDELVGLAKGAGFEKILLPWDFYGSLSIELGWRYWLADAGFLKSHEHDLSRTYHRLADDESRSCLQRLVHFRTGLDLDYSSFRHKDSQYFNGITLSYLEGKSAGAGGGYSVSRWRSV